MNRLAAILARTPNARRSLGLLFLTALLAVVLGSIQAQVFPVFRIGVLDFELGPLTNGARLAVQEINEAGGVTGADGTVFRLELVVQPATDIDQAVTNINQASVIAVLGPVTSQAVLNNLSQLQSLNVPILTPATDDTIIAVDTSDLVFRIRAQDVFQGRALANYMVEQLNATDLVTVQLDIESTASVIGFTTALSVLGQEPRESFLLEQNTTIEDLAQRIAARNPGFAVTYGPPGTASELYARLRASGWTGELVYNQANSTAFRDVLPPRQLSGIYSTTTWTYAMPDRISERFVLAYSRAFGTLPGPIEAAAYDAVYLLQEAIGSPGALRSNLASIRGLRGVQGTLNPADLTLGETSNNVAITQLGEFGAPQVIARYQGTRRIALEDIGDIERPVLATSTPPPSPTPDGVFLTVTRAVQNVRTGPGLNYDIIGQLREGSQAEVVGANLNQSWVVINFRGVQGWMSRGILDVTGDLNTVPIIAAPPTPTPPPATPTPTAPPIADIVVVQASPTRLIIGNPYTITVTVRNQGSSNAGPFAVATSLIPGNVFSAANIPSLAAGQQVTVNLTGTLGTGPTGPQSVVIVADLNDQIDEGTTGENNNDDFIYTYIADAPLLTGSPAVGTLNVADGGTTSLDGGSQDIQWGAGGIVPLGTTEVALIPNVTSIDQVHRDLIANLTLQNVPVTPITAGSIVAVRTDGAQKFGVLEVTSATAGGLLQFNFRMYD